MGSESNPTANEPQTLWGLIARWALGQEANTVMLVLILGALAVGVRDFFQVGLPAIEARHRTEREEQSKQHREERDLLLRTNVEQQTQWRETYKAMFDALKEKGMAEGVAVPGGNPVARK